MNKVDVLLILLHDVLVDPIVHYQWLLWPIFLLLNWQMAVQTSSRGMISLYSSYLPYPECVFNRSQTYEGGIGPYPGKEAHNGYTFCGLAAMEILGETHTLNVDKLTVWVYYVNEAGHWYCYFYIRNGVYHDKWSSKVAFKDVQISWSMDAILSGVQVTFQFFMLKWIGEKTNLVCIMLTRSHVHELTCPSKGSDYLLDRGMYGFFFIESTPIDDDMFRCITRIYPYLLSVWIWWIDRQTWQVSAIDCVLHPIPVPTCVVCRGPDYYHTCYCLSGLSTVQHMVIIDNEKAAMIRERGVDSSRGGIGSLMWKCNNDLTVFGDVENLLVCMHYV